MSLHPTLHTAAATAVTLLLTLIGAGCAGSTEVASLAQSPSGRHDEVLSWQSTATERGGRHLVSIGIETNPARLMGWARTDVQYRVLLDLSVQGPQVNASRTVTLPITEARQVGTEKEGQTILLAFDAAGAMQESGFRQVEPVDGIAFRPTPGTWTLSVRVRSPQGGNRKALKVIRTIHMTVTARKPAQGLSNWTPLPPKRFEVRGP